MRHVEYGMPVSMEFLRGVLGLIGVGCAYMAGRAVIAVRRGWQKPSRLYGWSLRTVLCVAAVAFRNPVDETDLIVWGLALAAFLGGLLQTSREKPHEDLTPTIFPDES
jgi:hypothetical protein